MVIRHGRYSRARHLEGTTWAIEHLGYDRVWREVRTIDDAWRHDALTQEWRRQGMVGQQNLVYADGSR